MDSRDPCLYYQQRPHHLSSVPQDLNASVTTLSLEHNNITTIDNSSLWQYRNLNKLSLSYNPLQEIKPGSFDNNPKLEVFTCISCELYQFPVDFGPAFASLRTIRLKWGIENITAFSQMRLDHFSSLSRLSVRGVLGIDLDSFKFPESLTHLGMAYMELVTFPNLSIARFPNLYSVNAVGNTFQVGSNFRGVTERIGSIIIDSSNLYSAEGLDVLQNLYRIGIKNNQLETLPDLLELPKLRRLFISGNSRMHCDKRMCWRRLWDRVREPLQQSDDVRCMEPPLLVGHAMSKVNPKFMQCSDGMLSINTNLNPLYTKHRNIKFFMISR